MRSEPYQDDSIRLDADPKKRSVSFEIANDRTFTLTPHEAQQLALKLLFYSQYANGQMTQSRLTYLCSDLPDEGDAEISISLDLASDDGQPSEKKRDRDCDHGTFHHLDDRIGRPN